ncbi:MAG: lysophospholipid acyltransferase family protein [Gammaproteobacteria bacterium]|nr:lysophospholipid acyltransferase family protein [Gammaproteobacteria bacterium]
MLTDYKKDNPVTQLSLKDKFYLWVLKTVGKLSLRSAHRLCDGLYYLVIVFPFKFKRVIAAHIQLCFPELSPIEQDKLIQASIRSTLYCLMEMPIIWFSQPEEVLKYVKQVSGEDLIMQATHSGKNILMLCPHLGSWEMFGLYASALYPSAGLYKPRKKAWQEEMIRQARERRGNVSMYPTTASGVKSLYRALVEKKWVGILADHDPGENGGVYVPFFGIQANTMTLAAKLVTKSEATVFIGFAERLPNSQGFHIHFILAEPGMINPNVVQAATMMNKNLETSIRMIPAQYEWSYKRFRRRPNNEASFYN